MRSWYRYVGAALGVALVGATISVTGALPALAQGSGRTFEALIINDSTRPVPVAVPTPLVVTIGGTSEPVPVAVPTPLIVASAPWQGTPFLTSRVVLNTGPFELCEVAFTAAPGTAVLLKTIAGDFNVPPNGGGGMRTGLTLPDGTERRVEVPMHRTAGALQVAGTYDRYAGSLVLDGFPVTQATVCLRGHDSAGSLEFIGFAVPLPE